MKCAICPRGAFQILQNDATLAGEIGERLLIEGRRGLVNDVVLGLVFGDGLFRALSQALQLVDAILKPEVRATCRQIF
jgi:hypothetical protein